MKSPRERLDILAAFRDLGSFRAAADLCGTTHKTVRRILELSAGEAKQDESLGVRLLADARRVFDARKAERISTKDLIAALGLMEESPWADWHERGLIKARALAGLLRPYGIRPLEFRFGESVLRGYTRAEFEDPWARYLPNGAKSTAASATSATAAPVAGAQAPLVRYEQPPVADAMRQKNPHEHSVVAAVAEEQPWQPLELGDDVALWPEECQAWLLRTIAVDMATGVSEQDATARARRAIQRASAHPQHLEALVTDFARLEDALSWN